MEVVNEPIKKYVTFLYYCYYPKGGMNDVSESFAHISDAIAFVKKNVGGPEYETPDAGQVVDRDTWEVVFDSDVEAE